MGVNWTTESEMRLAAKRVCRIEADIEKDMPGGDGSRSRRYVRWAFGGECDCGEGDCLGEAKVPDGL